MSDHISPDLARLDQAVQDAERELDNLTDKWLGQKILADQAIAKRDELDTERRNAAGRLEQARDLAIAQLHREPRT